MNPVLCKQLAADYCCSPGDVLDRKNHFTHHQFLEGRRRYEEASKCYLKIAVVNGKLLFSGDPDIIAWCQEQYPDYEAAWFFEAKNMRRLNNRLLQDNCQIEMIHPFYISERPGFTDFDGYDIQWYSGDDIEQFRGDKRFDKAYTFDKDAPDVLGVSASIKGQILGMAGASCDSPTMWQIGINVNPEARGSGIARMLVILLKNKILKKGILPFYGTSISHIMSQRVALGAGFVPAWAELITQYSPDAENNYLYTG